MSSGDRRDRDERSWFGPKRIGFGIRPQRWQGWVLTLVLLVIFILVILLIHRLV